jgi:hypothetical protein
MGSTKNIKPALRSRVAVKAGSALDAIASWARAITLVRKAVSDRSGRKEGGPVDHVNVEKVENFLLTALS